MLPEAFYNHMSKRHLLEFCYISFRWAYLAESILNLEERSQTCLYKDTSEFVAALVHFTFHTLVVYILFIVTSLTELFCAQCDLQ